METPDKVVLKRDVEATVVPVGTPVTLQAGETAYITQALGGTYTVVVNGNMFRVDGRDADALGLETAAAKPAAVKAQTREEVEQQVWAALKTCYDPEIPDTGTYKVDVKMTLTAPGCGMGPVIQQDAQSKILALENVDEVNVELVWDPPWHQAMMTEAARLELGLM
jgi:metal-sulfur cluster biosynthetic enzyme